MGYPDGLLGGPGVVGCGGEGYEGGSEICRETGGLVPYNRGLKRGKGVSLRVVQEGLGLEEQVGEVDTLVGENEVRRAGSGDLAEADDS